MGMMAVEDRVTPPREATRQSPNDARNRFM
jgi:hypothetical protein